MLKTCSNCQKTKSLSDFGKLARSPDGLSTFCRPCLRSYNRNYREANRPLIRAIAGRWRVANRLTAKERTDAWKQAYPEKQKASERNYRAKNPGKRKVSCAQYRRSHKQEERAYRQKYAAEHLAELAAKAAQRRATKLQATPSWANHIAIKVIYAEAQRLTRETGIPHHVDHIYPLQSDWVCGLHCEANLQILKGVENLSKGNRPPVVKGVS